MFEILTERVRPAAGEGEVLAARIRRIIEETSACAGALDESSSSFSEISGALRSLCTQMGAAAAAMKKYWDVLEQICRAYEAAERKICAGNVKFSGGGRKFEDNGGRPGAGTENAAGLRFNAEGGAETQRRGFAGAAGLQAETDYKIRSAGAAGLQTETDYKIRSAGAAGLQTETDQKTRSADTAEPEGGAAAFSGKQTASGISPGARNVLLTGGISPELLAVWEAQGLTLSRGEAGRYLPILQGMSRGERYPDTSEFAAYAEARMGKGGQAGSDYAGTSAGAMNVSGQVAFLGEISAMALSCFPNLAMTMDRTVEIPLGSGTEVYCGVSSSGKTSAKSRLKYSEAMDAHSGILKKGISLSTGNGSITYTGSGKKITVNTNAGKFSADGKSAAWTTEGKLSGDTTCELKLKVNYETGETSCEESLTTKIDQARVTTTMGIRTGKTDLSRGPEPYPGYAQDVKLQSRMQAFQNLLLEGLAPGLAADPQTVFGGIPVYAMPANGL